MTELAIAEPARASKPTKPGRRPRIPPRIAEAIRLLATGECKTQKAAAERVGMNAVYLCEALKKPHIGVFIDREARKTLSNGKLRASARMVELIDAGSEHVSLDAASRVLAIEGIAPPDRSQPLVNIAISPGYVVKLRHADASHTVDTRADGSAQVIDNVDDGDPS